MENSLKQIVHKVLETAEQSISYGKRGYMIDRRGDPTPIDNMYGHEAFVRDYTDEILSVMKFVADMGWVLIEKDNNLVTIVYHIPTVTKEAIATAIRIVNKVYDDCTFFIHTYDKLNDVETPVLKSATKQQASQFLVKLKVKLR